MAHSSSYYTRVHGKGSDIGVYGKSSTTSSSASAATAGNRPATLNLPSSSKTVPAPKTSPNPFTSSAVTTSSSTTTFATMGSSMMFQNKTSRYANPTVLPSVSIPPKVSSSTTTNLSTGNTTSISNTKLNLISSNTSTTTTTTCQSHLSSSSSQYTTYSLAKATRPLCSSYYPKPLTSASQYGLGGTGSTIQPKSSLNIDYGRTSIPYYQSRLSAYPSSQNLTGTSGIIEKEPSPVSSVLSGSQELPITLLKSRNITTDRERTLSGSGAGVTTSSGFGSSNLNLSNLGVSAGATTMHSKSSQNLKVDSFPNVFCLSCPPAEFKFSDAYRAKTLPRTGKENERLIGFATLPEQVHRKSVKKGFDFTLMVVGESGLGKSTLINSLFLADFYQNRKIPSVNEQINRTTTIQKHTIEIEERGVKLRLTVVDTPGFGDAINCEESWKTCVQYIDDQFHQFFQAESGLNRKHIQDTRVHCCLYFIPPYGRGLRALDLEVIKNLENRVNVIPIIAKSDTLTTSEVKRMKDQILHDLKSHQIQIYQFPDCDEEEDEEFKKQDRELKVSIPFAVASSLTFVDGKRGRQYPWGTVEIENPNHSDFGKLRTMLIQSHMHDLKETTQDYHYENFRAKAIAQISQGRNSRERTKLKRDSSSDSPQELLLQKEAEIKKMQQMISKMEAKLKAQNNKPPPPSRDSIIDL